MNNLIEYYKERVEHLTSYAPVYLFTKDHPSVKEKRLEQRVTKIVDSFYNMHNYNLIRECLRAVLADFQLGCNEVITDELLKDTARLQAVLEQVSKQIKQSVKPEKCLQEYYNTEVDIEFCQVLELLLEILSRNGNNKITTDVVSLKTTYYNEYKSYKKWLNSVDKFGNKNWK